MNKATRWLTLLANLGVIAGLVVLAYGIRQNTSIAEANAYFANRYGIIGDEEWLRFQAGACIHYQTAIANKLSLRFTTPGSRRYLGDGCKAEPLG
ncbi:MAG: hypothetical protein WBO04_08690 [Steroidobacteraceae bacterium]